MNEPVLCPYCGWEMQLHKGYKLFYECERCYARSPVRRMTSNKNTYDDWCDKEAAYAAAMKRAEPNAEITRLTIQLEEYQRVARQYREDAERYKALLDEAKREPPNRVLTMEELRQVEKPCAVWIEWDTEKNVTLEVILEVGYHMVHCNNAINWIDAYGLRWRCWLRKPTDEERAAVPWKEQEK